MKHTFPSDYRRALEEQGAPLAREPRRALRFAGRLARSLAGLKSRWRRIKAKGFTRSEAKTSCRSLNTCPHLLHGPDDVGFPRPAQAVGGYPQSAVSGAQGASTRNLLGRLNLEAPGRVKREDAEPEIRNLISNLLDRESQNTPLSLFERDALVVDVLHGSASAA